MTTTHSSHPAAQVILGIPFNNVTFAEAVEWVHQRILSRKPGYIATANLDFVKLAWEDPELQRILLEADLVVADGFPIVWLSRLFGPALKERVTGSDLVPMLAGMARDKGHSLYLLGGAPGVGEKAAQSLRNNYPGVRIAGQYSPPLADVITMDHPGILMRLEAAKPDILLIAFGAPKQEKFANFHVRTWSIPVSIGVGGTLDFLAGTQIRAPRIVQRLSLEWLWRMMTAPRRLVKRYWADLIFLLTTCGSLLKLRLLPDHPFTAPSEPARGHDPSPDILWASYTSRDIPSLESLFSAAGKRSIALDIMGVPWFSSTELGLLLQLAKTCRHQGCRLILFHTGTRIKRLMSTCRLTDYIDLIDSREEAVRRLSELGKGGRATQSEGNQLVIQTPLELTAANVDEFRVAMQPELDHSPAYSLWVVDLQYTKFMDSSALGLLASWRTLAGKRNTPITIRNAGKVVSMTFHKANVDTWLEKPPL
jgi:N-acetylglucosaminyldiphosphoundecaprenol N-acetyl-beta-D-mannosaminyltransferase